MKDMLRRLRPMLWLTIRIPFSFLSSKRWGAKVDGIIDKIEYRVSLKEAQAAADEYWDEGNISI
jgi:hypothetical protein